MITFSNNCQMLSMNINFNCFIEKKLNKIKKKLFLIDETLKIG